MGEPSNSDFLRSAEAVLSAIRQAKTGEMRSMLGTIQPDQDAYIRMPIETSVVVEGPPGSGKTVVAAHRAAFLSSTTGLNAGNVLLVGPSISWIKHVSPTLSQIVNGKISLRSVAGFLGECAALKKPLEAEEGNLSKDAIGGSSQLWQLICDAHAVVSKEVDAALGSGALVKQLTRALKKRDPLVASLLDDTSLWSWIEGYKPGKGLIDNPGYLGLSAAINVVCRNTLVPKFDHIIVDEAQDISPLTWQLLKLALRPSATMTLFGDLNQQHRLASQFTWADIFSAIDLGEVRVETLGVAYRTTRQILEYAAKYAPSNAGLPEILMEGPNPIEIEASDEDLALRLLAEAERLATVSHPAPIAVVADDVTGLSSALAEAGWIKGGEHEFKKGAMKLFVFDPRGIRGLEFNSVIVVKPDNFNGPQGPGFAYTSLTRASQNLVVFV